MTGEPNTARRFRVRGMRPGQMAAAAAWGAAVAGFAIYLASLDSFKEAYGSVGTGIVLLLWVTLFSVLYYATPDMRMPSRPPARPPAPGRRDRVVVPPTALHSPVAQGRMMSVLGPRAVGLSAREVDLIDWGFAYGVAWAVARHQDPTATDEVVSRRALHATPAVYETCRGSRGPRLGPEPHGSNGGPSAADPDANGSGRPDTANPRA